MDSTKIDFEIFSVPELRVNVGDIAKMYMTKMGSELIIQEVKVKKNINEKYELKNNDILIHRFNFSVYLVEKGYINQEEKHYPFNNFYILRLKEIKYAKLVKILLEILVDKVKKEKEDLSMKVLSEIIKEKLAVVLDKIEDKKVFSLVEDLIHNFENEKENIKRYLESRNEYVNKTIIEVMFDE
ncbi:hypothetical protein [Oceanivirga miroungae]|uniref:Uncharacterized protein n=1 Tax=Oceanivirga miroungae TaxID=1130046 RepID=A0A6I8MFI7_9FUSO|nr:hypothetical protein [Oceanivirga miroungae]VWL85890.1 hypothetical protein OMES3154_01176 [Oceanivirga miroungae]